MNKKIISALICVLFLIGCAAPETKTGKGALYGGVGGAAVGALLGQMVGHDTRSTLIGAAIGAAVGGGGGAAVGKMMDNQEKQMRETLAQSEAAAVSREGNMLAVTFKGDVTFNTNSAIVKSELNSEIDRVAGILNQYPNTLIRVEGHTDSKGSDALNMDLSRRRANAVRDILVQRGVVATRIEAIGYGKTMPVATNDTTAGRARNRRVEIKIVPPASQAQ